ncbi:hypothetical protein DSECCO2_216580 [anaerobic digester metagenome]
MFFHKTKSLGKFIAACVQSLFGVHTAALGDLGGNKQHVANFLLHAVRRVQRTGGIFCGLTQFTDFLVQLVQDTRAVRPVKPGLGGFALYFFGPPQGGKRFGHGVHRVCGGLLAFFLALENFPAVQLLGGVFDLHRAEYVGVAVDQLFADTVRHVVHGEAALFLFQLGVEHDLQKHVSQFFAKSSFVTPVNGLHRLAALLQKIPAERLVALLPIPRAAARCAKQLHNAEKVLVIIMWLTLKIYHNFSAFAR